MSYRALAATAGLLLLAAPAQALADCKLATVAELPADMSTGVPVVKGIIGGHWAKVLIDTGAPVSHLSVQAARKLGLPMTEVEGAELFHIETSGPTYEATVDSLSFGAFASHGLRLWATGATAPGGASLVLGDDFLSRYDVELDLPHGVVRLFEAQGCEPGQLDYWSAPYAIAPLATSDDVRTEVSLNGRSATAQITSGRPNSVVDVQTAAAAGVDAVSAALAATGRLPEAASPSWPGVFSTFAIGDETIRNARLDVAQLAAADAAGAPGMMLGSDFLRTHRVMIGFREHVIVFSYAGGAVFGSTGH